MRLAFLSPSVPWVFGPYQQQLAMVAAEFHRRESHEIIWISLVSQLKNRTYTAAEVLKIIPPATGFSGHPLKGIPTKYIGSGAALCGGAGWYTGSMNAVLSQHRVDAMISLMDHTRIFVDAPLNVPAFAWFPDHFVALDAHHHHIFAAYAGALALSPSSAQKVRGLMPYKRVEWVPHIVAREHSVRARGVVRAELGIQPGAFVVMVTFANYGHGNAGGRKAFDTSLQAFRSLLDTTPRALLFIHSVATIQVFATAAAAAAAPGVDLHKFIRDAGLPPSAVIVHEERVAYSRVHEMILMSDVLLHPSKTEGFGMGVLEAQLHGVPVITTNFGAMADYTMYGTAVPPRAPEATKLGVYAQPDGDGVTAALRAIAAGTVDGDRAQAISRIETHMSLGAVVDQFERLLHSPPSRPHLPHVRRVSYEEVRPLQGGHSPSAILRATESRWVLLMPAGSTLTVDEDALNYAVDAVSSSGTVSSEVWASGEVSARVDGAQAGVALILVTNLDGSTSPPSSKSPVIMSGRRLRETLNKGPTALDDYLYWMVAALVAAGPSGPRPAGVTVVVGAVPKPPRGC